MNGVKALSELPEILKTTNKNTKSGCLVDNSILFALSYPLDTFNENAEFAFNTLAKESSPVFTNVNIRTEFLELHRRVTIPESLIDLLEDGEESLDNEIVQKLKSLRTSYRKSQQDEKSYKLDDRTIKKFRNLLKKYKTNDKDGWEQFCEDYLTSRIQEAWNRTSDQWNLNFISLRSTEKHPLIREEVSWEGMVKLMERFGIGSMDAIDRKSVV